MRIVRYLSLCAAAMLALTLARPAMAGPCQGTLMQVVECLNKKLAQIEILPGPNGGAVLQVKGATVNITVAGPGDEAANQHSHARRARPQPKPAYDENSSDNSLRLQEPAAVEAAEPAVVKPRAPKPQVQPEQPASQDIIVIPAE